MGGQRTRYRRFVEQMVCCLRNDPEGFDFDAMNLLPSLRANSERKAELRAYLQSEQERILKDRETDRILAPLVEEHRQCMISSIGHMLQGPVGSWQNSKRIDMRSW